ncbi:MAG: hypothetical protein ACRDR6_19860 [Pseudonocardiaceae bacterium]
MPCPSSTSCGGIAMCRSSVERITAWASGCREWISELAAHLQLPLAGILRLTQSVGDPSTAAT